MATAAIEIDNLTKDYPFGFLHLKKRTSLEGLTMSVEEGEVFGFLGPNGAGKSTTIKLLVGLIFPTAGTARGYRLPAGAAVFLRLSDGGGATRLFRALPRLVRARPQGACR
jgi:ABC-type uncharacterized transport system ATPase subunit